MTRMLTMLGLAVALALVPRPAVADVVTLGTWQAPSLDGRPYTLAHYVYTLATEVLRGNARFYVVQDEDPITGNFVLHVAPGTTAFGWFDIDDPSSRGVLFDAADAGYAWRENVALPRAFGFWIKTPYGTYDTLVHARQFEVRRKVDLKGGGILATTYWVGYGKGYGAGIVSFAVLRQLP